MPIVAVSEFGLLGLVDEPQLDTKNYRLATHQRAVMWGVVLGMAHIQNSRS